MGINLQKSNSELKTSMFLIIPLSLFTPIGICIGLIVGSDKPLIEGIFLSLSVGTFLYIATTEIIVEEFSFSRNKMYKILSLLIGILFVALILVD